MKKYLLGILVVIVLASITLAGCTTGSTTPATSSAPPPTQAPTSSAAPSTAPVKPPTTNPPADQPKYGGAFKMIKVGGITAWDAPTETSSFLDMTIKNIVYMPILYFDNDGNWKPRIATNYAVSPDGKTVTLTLKKGIKFHDGTELTSKDIKYHIENFTVFGAKMGESGGYKNVASVAIPDDYTVVLNLKKPDAAMPVGMAMNDGTINSSTAVLKPTTPENKTKDHVAGIGPFKYVEWKRDVHFKAEKFKDYFIAGQPYLDSYQVNFFADRVSALLAFKNGEGQGIYDLAPKDALTLKQEGYPVYSTSFANYVLTPDGANADSPFAKKEVRQAVEYALDRKTLAESFGYGFYQPLTQLSAPEFKLAYNPSIAPRDYDPAKAKQLLKDAGYANGLNISLYAQLSDPKELLTAIQGYLNAAGFNAKIEVGDPGKFHGEWSGKGWHNGVIFRGYGFQANIAENFTNWWRHPPNGQMFTSVYYPENWDSRCDAMVSEPDPVKRAAMIQDLVKTIHDEAMSIPICTYPIIFAFGKNVGGGDSYAPISSHLQTPEGLWIK